MLSSSWDGTIGDFAGQARPAGQVYDWDVMLGVGYAGTERGLVRTEQSSGTANRTLDESTILWRAAGHARAWWNGSQAAWE